MPTTNETRRPRRASWAERALVIMVFFAALLVLAFPVTPARAQVDDKQKAICATIDPLGGFYPQAYYFQCACDHPKLEIHGVEVTLRVVDCYCLCAPAPEGEAARP